jgi:hypothetical protein
MRHRRKYCCYSSVAVFLQIELKRSFHRSLNHKRLIRSLALTMTVRDGEHARDGTDGARDEENRSEGTHS